MQLDDWANVATVAAGLGTVVAAIVAVPALRATNKAADLNARAHELNAVSETNRLWDELNDYANMNEVEFATVTVAAIRKVFDELSGGLRAAIDTDVPPSSFRARVPFAAGALLAMSHQPPTRVPEEERQYQRGIRVRTLTFGYVRAALGGASWPDWVNSSDREVIKADFLTLDEAMTGWVNKLNQIAELYETSTFDRRKFIGKRSVAVVQQLYVAEPYVLWRNSTVPGRWGLRTLGLGVEARNYHWKSPLQQARIRQRLDPLGFEPTGSYPGFSVSLGWIIGPGDTADSSYGVWRAERRIKRSLGRGFNTRAKTRQGRNIASLPRNTASGLTAVSLTWADLVSGPLPSDRSHQ